METLLQSESFLPGLAIAIFILCVIIGSRINKNKAASGAINSL